jgi:AcrR family transcriptional regulator
MATDARRSQRRDARENCEKVLKAARAVFVRAGLDASMEEIARVAGVGVGTIYRRYPGKDQLLTALVEETTSLLLSAVEDVLVQPKAPGALVRDIVHVHYRMAAQHAMLLDLEAPKNPNYSPQECVRTQAYLRSRDLLVGLLQAGMDHGDFRPVDPLPIAAAMMELLHWDACERVRTSLGLTVEAAADHTAEFLLGGLKAT